MGEAVRLRIRARDVALATRRPRAISIRNVLPGTVVEVSEQPNSAYAEALVDIGGGRLRARITREAAADLGLRTGTRVYALVKSISFEHRRSPLTATGHELPWRSISRRRRPGSSSRICQRVAA